MFVRVLFVVLLVFAGCRQFASGLREEEPNSRIFFPYFFPNNQKFTVPRSACPTTAISCGTYSRRCRDSRDCSRDESCCASSPNSNSITRTCCVPSFTSITTPTLPITGSSSTAYSSTSSPISTGSTTNTGPTTTNTGTSTTNTGTTTTNTATAATVTTPSG